MPDVISRYQSKPNSQILASAQIAGTQGIIESLKTSERYMYAIDQMGKAGGNLFRTWQNLKEERDTRDADTYASKLFRDRRVEIAQTVKGKDADGLLDREYAWQDGEFNTFKEKFGNLPTKVAKDVWARHANRYLDRTGSYMVEQQAQYDKKSRMDASDAYNDELVLTDIGDIGALAEVMEKHRANWKDDPIMAEREYDKAIMTAVTTWTRENPYKTVKWFKQNKETLKAAFGSQYPKVANAIDRAEAKILQEAQHAEVLASRAVRIQAQQDKAYSDGKYSDIMGKIATGEVSAAEVYALMDDPKVSGQVKHTVYTALKSMETAEAKRRTEAAQAYTDDLVNYLYARAVDRGWNDESGGAKDLLMKAIVAGKVDSKSADQLITRCEKLNTLPADIKTFMATGIKYTNGIYKGADSLFSIPGKGALEQANQIESIIEQYVYANADKPAQLAKDLNINDPNSWIRRLVEANPAVQGSDIGTTFNGVAAVPDWTDSDTVSVSPTRNAYATTSGQTNKSRPRTKAEVLNELFPR